MQGYHEELGLSPHYVRVSLTEPVSGGAADSFASHHWSLLHSGFCAVAVFSVGASNTPWSPRQGIQTLGASRSQSSHMWGTDVYS